MGQDDDRKAKKGAESRFPWTDSPTPERDLCDFAFGAGLLAAATCLGFVLDAFGMDACIVICYVLIVQCVALVTIRRLHCVLTAALGVALYNFFFTTPRYSLSAWGSTYPATFAVMFAAAVASSYVALSLRREVHRSEEASRRSRELLVTNRLLQGCGDEESIVRTAGTRLALLSGRAVVWYQSLDDGSLAAEWAFTSEGPSTSVAAVAPAMPPVLDGGAYVGRPLGQALGEEKHGVYLTVQDQSGGAGPGVVGAYGIDADQSALNPDELNIMAAIAGETSLALDREAAVLQREAAAVQAKNQQLRADLLRSISHDLRTPLTSIAGNADVLLSDADALTAADRARLAKDIRDDARWLSGTVENLLATTRLHGGGSSLRTSPELLDDVIEEAMRHVGDPAGHGLEVVPSDEPLLVNVDAHLMVQVVVNLVGNALAYTPAGSRVRVSSWRDGAWVRCAVEDDGPGIAEEDRARVFDSFYTAGRKRADGQRSVGLGLALCRSIVSAHGGQIGFVPVEPHGCRFEFRLPAVDLAQEGEPHA